MLGVLIQQRMEELRTTEVWGQYSCCHGLPDVSSEQRIFSFLLLAVYACSRSFEYKKIIQYLPSTVV